MGDKNNLLTGDGFSKDRDRSHHAQKEERRMTPTLSPFGRPGSLHSPPSAECYVAQTFTNPCNFDPKLMPKEQNQITMRKSPPSYNPFFSVVQITILATARIARNTTRFSSWFRGKKKIVYDVTNIEQHELLGFDAGHPLPDVIPKRANPLTVVEGGLSRLF